MSQTYDTGTTVRSEPVRAPRGTFGAIRLFRIAGIDIRADWSLFFIFAIVTFSLAMGFLPRLHPSWSGATIGVVALAAAVLFFLSILLHELSHALVGRAQGIPVSRITLFVFGGVTHLEGEPKNPKAELLMAIVGPLTSIGIGIGATLLGTVLLGDVRYSDDPEEIVRGMGPISTILMWLGPINLLLGIFNLVPGFPLDGGRVLRATLWWITNDMLKATHWASIGGRAFGLLLITIGVVMIFGFRVPFFGTGFVGGLWLVLIGWFLHNAARASYEQLVIRHRLAGVPVTDVMRSRLYTVHPDLTIARLVGDYLFATDQTSFPVVEGMTLVGIVSARHVRTVPRDQWAYVTVRQVMTPAQDAPVVDANAGANEALEKLATSDEDQLSVVDHGELRGFVRTQDILRWLTLQPEPVH